MGNHERGPPEKEPTKDLVEDQLNFGEEAIKSLLESSIMQQDDIVKIDQTDEHTSPKQHRETSRTTVTAPWPNDISPNVPFKNNQIISKIMHEEAMKQTRSVAFDETSGKIKVDNSTSSLEASLEDDKRDNKNSKQTLQLLIKKGNKNDKLEHSRNSKKEKQNAQKTKQSQSFNYKKNHAHQPMLAVARINQQPNMEGILNRINSQKKNIFPALIVGKQ